MSTDRLSNKLGEKVELRIRRLIQSAVQDVLGVSAFPMHGDMMDRRLIVFSNQVLHQVFSEVLGQKNCANPSDLSRQYLVLLRTAVKDGFIDTAAFIDKMNVIVFATLDFLLEVEPERFEPVLMPHERFLKSSFEY